MLQYLARMLLVYCLFMLAACTSLQPTAQSPLTNTDESVTSGISPEKNKLEDNESGEQQYEPKEEPHVVLSEVVITKEELIDRASFDLFWPVYLPEGLAWLRAGGMKSGPDKEIWPNIFSQYYGNEIGQTLTIRQYLSSVRYDTEEFESMAEVNIQGEKVTVYEEPRKGASQSFHFEYHSIWVTIYTNGITQEETLKIITNLRQ